MTSPNQVLQFRLFLEHIQPRVWRRIQVPADFTLVRLHRLIQTVMGWRDYHLHEFTFNGRVYGIRDPDDDREVTDERAVRLRDLPLLTGDRVEYRYDFGDNWKHVLEVEEVLQRAADEAGPLCLDGDRSTPPEDVGGITGYEEFLEALADAEHEEHEHMKTWVGRPFDPAHFSASEVNERLRKRFRTRQISRRS